MKNQERRKQLKLNKLASSILTIMLMSSMFMGAAGPAVTVQVHAADDTTGPVIVVADSETGDQSVEVGNITTTEGSGIIAASKDGKDASVTAESVSSYSNGATAVTFEGTTNISVEGSVESSNKTGIVAHAVGEDASSTITVGGDVSGAEIGLHASSDIGATSTVKVGGNVSSSDDYGIRVSPSRDQDGTFGTVDINVGGNVSSASSDGIFLASSVKGGDVSIKVGGDVTSQTEDAVDIASYFGTKIKVDISGNVSGDEMGMYLDGDEGGTLDVNVKGNVSSNEGEGIDTYAWNDAKTTVHIGGNVSSVEEDGLYASSYQGGDLKVNIDGNVTSDKSFGVQGRASEASNTEIVIGGDVIGEQGINLKTRKENPELFPGDASISMRVEGNVTGTRNYGAQVTMREDGGSTQLEIGGDLNGQTSGLNTSLNDAKQKADVLVVGTIAAEEGIPVQLYGGAETADNLKLTVWQIVPKDGIVAANAVGVEDEQIEYTQNQAFEQSIKYIIKLEQPKAGGSLSATKADGSALEKSHDFDTALEGDKVLLKVNLDPGYRIKAAFNGLGEKVELIMDSKGNYYVEVPKGGGVYLSVDLEKEKYSVRFVDEDGTELQNKKMEYGDTPSYTGKTPTKAEDEHYTYSFSGWTPEIDKVTGEITYKATFNADPKSFSLSFDLGEGVLDGKTGIITIDAKYGDTITLPGAPTREGYTFLYWKGSRYDAGASYTVDGQHNFTAVWEKNADDAAPSNQTPDKTTPASDSTRQPKAASDKPELIAPKTGDDNNMDLWIGLLAVQLGIVAAILMARRASKENE